MTASRILILILEGALRYAARAFARYVIAALASVFFARQRYTYARF